MAYPIKNYRINLADEKGEKWKYDFPYGKPERRFTLKADFMSSGHWTNTGLTKWINDNLYQYDEKNFSLFGVQPCCFDKRLQVGSVSSERSC